LRVRHDRRQRCNRALRDRFSSANPLFFLGFLTIDVDDAACTNVIADATIVVVVSRSVRPGIGILVAALVIALQSLSSLFRPLEYTRRRQFSDDRTGN
jgi:hypothetical protein